MPARGASIDANEEYDESAYLVVKSTVRLSTELFETRDGKLAYSIDTTTFDKESDFEILDDLTTAIVDQLQRDDLIFTFYRYLSTAYKLVIKRYLRR